MNLVENKKEFYINSRNRLSGTDSDFTYALDIRQEDNFDSVVVHSCIIPKSYYLVENGHNTFTLVEDVTNTVITMDVGNYDRRSFANVLTDKLNTLSPNGWVYSITYPSKLSSADTGKYTFSVSGNTSHPQFVFPNSSKLYEPCGFNFGSTNVFTDVSGVSTLVSVNVIKLQREDTLLINSDICSNDNSTGVLQEVFSATNDPNYCNIVYTMNDLEICSKKLTNASAKIFRFTITDENFNVINLNGLNVTIVLVVYRSNRVSLMLSQFLKFMTIQKLDLT